ncbi:MAG TPA: trypsin-like peptidase domain-containing protein [Bacillota bacterium]
MKNSFIFPLMILLTLLVSPLFVSADDNNSVLKNEFNIEDFVDTSKPFKMENGEMVDTLEYFEDGIESITPYLVIGKDGRKKVANPFVVPYKPMTYLLLEFDDYISACSGTLVANYKVLTNAHCLAEENLKTGKLTGNKVNVAVALTGVKDNHYSQAYWGKSYHYPGGYDKGIVALDYGVIALEKDSRPAPGITNGTLPIKTVKNLSNNQSLKVYGYPGDKTPPLDLWGMKGNLLGQSGTIAYYDMDTYNGQSGSAVLNNSNEIVVLHSSGFMFDDHSLANGGPKMTNSVVKFIKNNGN